jgi:uncharacterized repeat protein (TIGR03847 family)
VEGIFMAEVLYDLNPVTWITAGAVGHPGQRTFYIQARQGTNLVTLLAEKEQVQALAIGIEQLLDVLAAKRPEGEPATKMLSEADLALLEPLDAVFRVGDLGLGYDEQRDLLVLVAQELLEEEEQKKRQPVIARFWATPAQMRALSCHAANVVAAGRPLCPLCGLPIDPAGHICPKRNGHGPATPP